MVDYRRWSEAYPSMPLFRDMTPEDVVRLLERLAPRLVVLPAGGDMFDYCEDGLMYLCVGSGRPVDAPSSLSQREVPAKWAMPSGIDEPGLLAAEIPTLCGPVQPYGPDCELPRYDYDIEYLAFSLDDLMNVQPDLQELQLRVIRNLMGIVAQVVVDTRVLFYKARWGVDAYRMTPEQRAMYPDIHYDPIQGE